MVGLSVVLVTLAILGSCGDGCGWLGNFFLLQHYSLHAQALTLSYSAVGLVALTSNLLPYISERINHQTISDDDETFSLLFQILKEDERSVLAALTDAGGYSSQREISRMTGLSRLKTHRVVMRLKERGLVKAERQGRTSQVSLPPWLITRMKDN